MLTKQQEDRLRDALEELVHRAPSGIDLQMPSATRRRRTGLVGVVAFVVVLAIFVPLAYVFNQDAPSPSSESNSTTSVPPPATTVAPDVSLAFGEPEALASAGGFFRVIAVGDVLYAARPAAVDQVLRSTDSGSNWEPILEASPGDSEGLFAAGDLVALVISDDNPARDTIEPHSVVNNAPRVLVFDPESGSQTETALARPEDPPMEGLPLDDGPIDQSDTGCALGGYQSWIEASTVAVGDRIVVGGDQQLVGRLDDGTVICDGATYRSVVWTSDDQGQTFQMHDSVPLEAIAWTGDKFVGWSTRDVSRTSRSLLTSEDGVTWTDAGSLPGIPDDAFLSGTSIDTDGNQVVAWAGVQAWSAQIPDDVTDPEQLRDALDLDSDADVEQVLTSIGVDLPLDDAERSIIRSFNGTSQPIGAVLATSDDGGNNWNVRYVSEPIRDATYIDGTYLAVSSALGDPSDPNDDSTSLLTSTDGINWSSVKDLEGAASWPNLFAATKDAVYVTLDQSGMWRIPITG